MKVPVLVVHNLDPAWEAVETEEALQALRTLMSALAEEGHPVTDLPVTDRNLAVLLRGYDPDRCVVLNWCEELPGLARSDVMAARIMESLGFTYTGATPETLDFTWNKAQVKSLLERSGIPTPRWRVFDSEPVDEWQGYPAIVKPEKEHCSIGVTREAVVLDAQALDRRVRHVVDAFGQAALVEDFIDGREFHVTLWGNGDIELLPPAEMDFSAFSDVRDRLCTYDSKFTPGSVHYEKIEMRIPAALSEQEYEALKKTAIRTYEVTNCRDYARVDLRLGNGLFYVLDVNPNADISPETSLFYAAEAAGYSFGAFASRLVHFAAQRHHRLGSSGH